MRAHRELGGRVLLPIHWATFNLAFHRWAEPVQRVLAAAARSGCRWSSRCPASGSTSWTRRSSTTGGRRSARRPTARTPDDAGLGSAVLARTLSRLRRCCPD